MAVLTAIVDRQRPVGARALAVTIGRLAAFLVGLLAVGLLIVPRAMRAVVRLEPARDDARRQRRHLLRRRAARAARSATRSRSAPSSPARWSPSRARQKAIEHLVQPVRDMFAAIFFVVGRHADRPGADRSSTGAPIARAHRRRHRRQDRRRRRSARSSPATARATSVQAGMSLAQIGEFSFIIAALGLSLRRDARLPLSGRGRRLGDHDADHAVADPRLRARRALGRSQAAATAADVRRALRELARAPARRRRSRRRRVTTTAPFAKSDWWCASS